MTLETIQNDSAVDIVNGSTIYDVLVIGGGPAGLAVATGVARQLYNAVVFDSGIYRNARAHAMHNVPGWDDAAPADFRAKIRSDLDSNYSTVRFEQTCIEKVRETENGQFEAEDANGRRWKGLKLALATGVRDVFPDISGYDDLWGRGIYHCLFCHGYEDRGCSSVGVLAVENVANTQTALHMAYMSRRLAKRVVIYTHGADDVADQLCSAIPAGFDFEVERRRIERISKGTGSKSDVIVHLADGEERAEGFIVHKPRTSVNGPFAQQLPLELTKDGDVWTSNEPFPETSMHGVFAIGDCGSSKKSVMQAMAIGGLGASGLAVQLQMMP